MFYEVYSEDEDYVVRGLKRVVDTPETNATNVLPSNEHSMKCDICQRNENRSSNSLVTFEMFIFDMMTHLTKKMFSLIALQTSPPVVQLKSSIIS